MLFDRMNAGKELAAAPFATVHKLSTTSCAQQCLFTPLCMSFSFCSPNICKLFNSAFLSKMKDLGGSVWANSPPNCRYRRMHRKNVPVCFENGLRKDIQDDANPGICEINLKRIDATYTEWSEVLHVANATDLIYHKSREVVQVSAFGGRQEAISGVASWLKWYLNASSYSEAELTCQGVGGHVFNALDGTERQLTLLSQNLDWQSFWIGVKDEVEEGTWRDSLNNSLDANVIHWTSSPNEPNGGTDENCLVFFAESFEGNPTNMNYFVDANCETQSFVFACQLV